MNEKSVDQFLKNVNDNINVNITWDETINSYVKSIEKVKLIMNNSKLKQEIDKEFIGSLEKFINKSEHPEFHIAFVGAIKAGKSTLINALLGCDLASTAVTPETASLTKFKASKNNNYVKLTFYNNIEWNMLMDSVEKSKSSIFLEEFNKLEGKKEEANWINKETLIKNFNKIEDLKEEIKKWTSSKEVTHYFVKEVEVGLKNFLLPEGVIFVDTPGLDDPVQYRSDITRKYIDRANAVLVCVKSDSLTGSELNTIYSVFANSRYNREKIYIVGTQLDTLNDPMKDWEQQQLEWIKVLKRNDCYASEKVARKNLIPVAAYLRNLVRQYPNINKKSKELETFISIAIKFIGMSAVSDLEENLIKLNEYTNIENLRTKLENEIIQKHKKLLIEDLTQDYKNLKEDIILRSNRIKERQENVLETSKESIEQIREKIEESRKDLQASEAEEKEMERILQQVKSATSKRADELFNTINNMWRG